MSGTPVVISESVRIRLAYLPYFRLLRYVYIYIHSNPVSVSVRLKKLVFSGSEVFQTWPKEMDTEFGFNRSKYANYNKRSFLDSMIVKKIQT